MAFENTIVVLSPSLQHKIKIKKKKKIKKPTNINELPLSKVNSLFKISFEDSSPTFSNFYYYYQFALFLDKN